MKYIFLIFWVLTSCSYTEDRSTTKLIFKPFFKYKFKRPIDFVYSNAEFAYVVEQRGKIWQIDMKNDFKKKLIFDISNRLNHRNEEGLLSMVFDPAFKVKNFIYIYYTRNDNKAVVSRFTLEKNKMIHLKSELILLQINQPYSNHNGGQLAFGKDGYLYIGVGDGGSAGDPLKVGQSLNTLLGKILRIDITKKMNDKNYSIPKDNPFIGDNGEEEIFAYGLRNPWTFSFDMKTNQLFCGDVGQYKKEEINLIVKKGNYGWSIKEGDLIYDKNADIPDNLIDPIISYGRNYGASVVGGFVYRGEKLKVLKGYYIYTDYISGNLWGLSLNKKGKIEKKISFIRSKLNISRFAQDYKNELYVCSFAKNKIFKLVDVKELAKKND